MFYLYLSALLWGKWGNKLNHSNLSSYNVHTADLTLIIFEGGSTGVPIWCPHWSQSGRSPYWKIQIFLISFIFSVLNFDKFCPLCFPPLSCREPGEQQAYEHAQC